MNVNRDNEQEGPRGLRRTQAERSQATRGALIEASRTLFGARSYAEVSTEEIVREAGVTRGALYHHFEDKRHLFEAVYEQIEAELAERVARGSRRAGAASPLTTMQVGAELFLEVCTEPEVQRIVLLDGPSVLGWDRWRAIAAEHGLGLIEASLRAAIDAGAIPPQPVIPLAHLLMGALDEAAILVARAEAPEQTREEVRQTIKSLLAGLGAARR